MRLRLANEFDAPWKAALEWFLEPFLALCFPDIHAQIDWSVRPTFLDTQLQQIAPEHRRGPRTVDKLVRVRLRDGREEWLLIHIEVQAQRQGEFPERVFVYYYRLRDKFHQTVVSLAVLADDDPAWCPCRYQEGFGGCDLTFRFPVFKVLALQEPEQIFERTGNPFALLVAAHQAALATQDSAAHRCLERLRLVKYLHRHGLSREQVRNLFRVMVWLTRLPDEWELRFRNRLTIFERKQTRMTTLLAPFEIVAQKKGLKEGLRKGRQEGLREGLQEGLQAAILQVLATRFRSVPARVRQKVQGVTEDAALRTLLQQAVESPKLTDFLARL